MQTLLTAAQLAERVQALGMQISRDVHGRPLTVIGVLHGSVVFVADLIRAMSAPHQLGFVLASSYPGEATSPWPVGSFRLIVAPRRYTPV